MIIKVAIVEDEKIEADNLINLLKQYEKINDVSFSIDVFNEPLHFIANYKPLYDIVFMDIAMPKINGYETAKILYSIDKNVSIVFVTSMSQYAINGYEVDAADFILKPIDKKVFLDRLNHIMKKIESKDDKFILVFDNDQVIKLNVNQIYYIESVKHYFVYHTSNGEYKERGNMKDLELKMKDYGFFRCHSGFLINLKYVTSFDNNNIYIDKKCIPLSRNRKNDFNQTFMDYMGS